MSDERPTALIGVKVTPAVADALKHHAAVMRKPVSQVVREWIDEKLKEYEL